MSAATHDEEAPLTKELKEVGAETPRPEDDPDYDPELQKYGGPFSKKIAFLQVTLRLPLDPNPLNIIALLYGFLPFIIPGSFAVHWLMTRHLIPLYGLALSLIASLINEACFKPLFNDPRPSRSANKYKDKDGKWHMKHGMPSGHVLNATAILVWATLEVGLRGPGMDEHLDLTIKWLIGILLLMAPVPWARWYNGDHSVNQCLVAGAIGLVFGMAAYYIRITYFPNRWKPWHMDEQGLISTLAPILQAVTSTTHPATSHTTAHAAAHAAAHATTAPAHHL